MTHTQVTHRPDMDIQADVERLMLYYPPLMKDRRSIQVQVSAGAVKVTGNVQTPNTRRYFLDAIPGVAGVTAVDGSELYDDESIRLEAGRLLPNGVNVGRCQYGSVVLVGPLPPDTSADELVAQIQQVPGVRQVLTDLT